jgi:dihydropteroate synthase
LEPVVQLRVIKDQREALAELRSIGADPASLGIMAPKMQHLVIKIKDMDIRAANVLKQEMLAKGAEAAVNKWASTFRRPTTDVVLMGTVKQYRLVIEKLKIQPYGLARLVEPIVRILGCLEPSARPVACRGRSLPLDKKTLVMGILNVTPDSFSEQGLYFDVNQAVEHALQMAEDGADIIDVGGESTRPGSLPVDAAEEIRRIVPVISALSEKSEVPISVDTRKAQVAGAAIEAGAAIVNDVSALADEKMADLCAKSEVGVVLMHMRGEPQRMQDDPIYEDLMAEITGFLGDRIELAVQAGIGRERIFIDPGIGFGKMAGDNLEIMKRLAEFRSLGAPIVLGTSRKSIISSVLGGLEPSDRIEGTAATVAAGIMNGARIVRVHDVKPMARVASMTDAILKGGQRHG